MRLGLPLPTLKSRTLQSESQTTRPPQTGQIFRLRHRRVRVRATTHCQSLTSSCGENTSCTLVSWCLYHTGAIACPPASCIKTLAPRELRSSGRPPAEPGAAVALTCMPDHNAQATTLSHGRSDNIGRRQRIMNAHGDLVTHSSHDRTACPSQSTAASPSTGATNSGRMITSVEADHTSLVAIIGAIVLLVLAGAVAATWESPFADTRFTVIPNERVAGWRRTVSGWEWSGSWHVQSVDQHCPIAWRVHPLVLASLQVLLSLAALAGGSQPAPARNTSGDPTRLRRTHARSARCMIPSRPAE